MAIKLAKELPNGVVGDYWRVTHYAENFDKSVAEGSLALYVNKEKRDAGLLPIYTQSYSIPIENIITLEARDSVYEYLKNNDLNGGEDA